MLNKKIKEIKHAIVMVDKESKAVLLDFDNKKVEVKRLIEGYKKYEKENPEAAKQMEKVAQAKMKELHVFEEKFKQIEVKQNELRKKLMNLFNKKEEKPAHKIPFRTIIQRVQEKAMAAEPEKININKPKKEEVKPVEVKRPAVKVKKIKKPVELKKEEKEIKLAQNIIKKDKASLRGKAEEAAEVQKKLADLATGKVLGNF